MKGNWTREQTIWGFANDLVVSEYRNNYDIFSNNKRKLCNFASNGTLRFEMLGYEKSLYNNSSVIRYTLEVV